MCLTEALNQWNRILTVKNFNYWLYYNSNHCICAEPNIENFGNYLPFQKFGKEYFENSFNIKSKILDKYFELNN